MIILADTADKQSHTGGSANCKYRGGPMCPPFIFPPKKIIRQKEPFSMQIIADLHTHTNVTDHAFSTLTEMVQAAEDRGLAAIAITNHGPTNPDGPHEWHFSNLDLIPRKIGKVTVIRGIEFDITAPAGGINVISNKSLKPIEFALASFHECMFPPVDSSVHTAALEAILYNPYVNAFGHLGNSNFPFDHEYIISRCNDHGKIVEINNASLSIRKGSHDNCMDIARLCMKYEVPISVDSDSHICYRVGHVEGALEMLEEIGFPEELIINSSVERLDTYFKGRGLYLFDE
ncbi:phosphatase [Butyricicoccus sp. AM32-19]|nr:phosphatase [Butyricicoccus sp. AM32-19]